LLHFVVSLTGPIARDARHHVMQGQRWPHRYGDR